MAEVRGGDKAAAALRKIVEAVGRGAVAKVGFFEGATEADGTSVPLVAALNEYGTKNSPPRPFFRQTIDSRADAWAKNIGTALKKTGYDAKTAMGLVGQGAKEDIQRTINQFATPPNAPSTIARKGFDHPLIDTATLLNSVGVEVE